MRVGFLFNHATAHQVAHALPIANVLPSCCSKVEIEVFATQGAVEQEIFRLCEVGSTLRIFRLRGPSRTADFATRLSGNAVPADRISILRRNLDLFRNLEALVVPEKTSLILKTRFGLDHLKFIHTRHGAGDRAIGFDRASGHFDLVLMSGPKIRDRFQERGLLKPEGHAIVGYPKFDLLRGSDPPALFDNGKPTVLYNPHPSPALSSWYRMGQQVLDFFAKSDQFNLIFAPHVMLFAKRFNIALSPLSLAKVGGIPATIHDCAHIHVDTGSLASIDMSYTRMADIYLGDASSQVYEFLARPRPCIFLNPNSHDWRGSQDFAHWQAGPVVQNLTELDAALKSAVAQPAAYSARQQDLFAYSFDLNETPSSHRAARAIIDFLGC